jgi:hypothetical protein
LSDFQPARVTFPAIFVEIRFQLRSTLLVTPDFPEAAKTNAACHRPNRARRDCAVVRDDAVCVADSREH